MKQVGFLIDLPSAAGSRKAFEVENAAYAGLAVCFQISRLGLGRGTGRREERAIEREKRGRAREKARKDNIVDLGEM